MANGTRITVKILIALVAFSSFAVAKPKRSAKKSGTRNVRTSARRLSGSQVSAEKRAWDRSEQLRQRRLYEAAQRSAAAAINFQSSVDQAVFNIPPTGTFEPKRYPIPEPAPMPHYQMPEISLSPKTSSQDAPVERRAPEPRYMTEYIYIQQPEAAPKSEQTDNLKPAETTTTLGGPKPEKPQPPVRNPSSCRAQFEALYKGQDGHIDQGKLITALDKNASLEAVQLQNKKQVQDSVETLFRALVEESEVKTSPASTPVASPKATSDEGELGGNADGDTSSPVPTEVGTASAPEQKDEGDLGATGLVFCPAIGQCSDQALKGLSQDQINALRPAMESIMYDSAITQTLLTLKHPACHMPGVVQPAEKSEETEFLEARNGSCVSIQTENPDSESELKMAAILAFVDRTLKPIDKANLGKSIHDYGQSIHQTLFGFYERKDTPAVQDLLKKGAPKDIANDPVKFKAWAETDGLAHIPTMMIAKNILAPECFGELDGVFRFFLKHEQELKKVIEEQCLETAATARWNQDKFERDSLFTFLNKVSVSKQPGEITSLSGSSLSQFQGRPKSEACPAMARRLKAFQAMLDYESKKAAPGLLDAWAKFNERFLKERKTSH